MGASSIPGITGDDEGGTQGGHSSDSRSVSPKKKIISHISEIGFRLPDPSKVLFCPRSFLFGGFGGAGGVKTGNIYNPLKKKQTQYLIRHNLMLIRVTNALLGFFLQRDRILECDKHHK